MIGRSCCRTVCLALLALLALPWLASDASAQVPQDTTFTGRLVDAAGSPLSGPVDLELRVFDAESGGTQLYSEEHPGTVLDATGAFSVQLGLGTNPSGTFDASLFSEVDRWLEVVVGADVLAPRQTLGSVPWALVAERLAPWDGSTIPRFEDCGDGTVADHQRGLQWEKKTGVPGTVIHCEGVDCPDPHDVNNQYAWSDSGSSADGKTFTDFLARLNATFDPTNPTGCFAGQCDWRLPEISELQTILTGPDADPGQPAACPGAPDFCMDPDFAALAGPWGSAGAYWSASPVSTSGGAWTASFFSGWVIPLENTLDEFVRAVRTGSCH